MIKYYLQRFTIIILFASVVACQKDAVTETVQTNKTEDKIFNLLDPSSSGLAFSNQLKEDSVVNYFTYPYIYMGGGVAIGDVNNDGLQDVYLTGNMVQNKLYLNKGELKFEDITDHAKVGSDNRWVTGVTMADVNGDGWIDIYVSVSGKFATTKNQLFLNNGVDSDGLPSFTEAAEERGIADEGQTTQGTFFDYDNDGDLDLYTANYPLTGFKTPTYSFKIFKDQKVPEKSDHLFQNDGNGYFKKVTEESGLLSHGLSLSATASDFNNDGWTDLYVSNDFASSDYFFFNNGDGTFSEKIQEATQHTAFFGMGADAGDFNNDGLLDILQMDMTPADNRRNKANMASMNIDGFWEIVNSELHYQYMQNTLQLNQGIGEDGLPHFSDISRMNGMSSTDWSWAGLFADLDNDGWKDIFITNGTRRDINNKDYFNRIENANYQEKQTFNNLDLTLNMPSERVANCAYKNNSDLTFTKVDKDWGLDFSGYSNGAAYVDLDNDGDLEIIVNNIDQPALVYENKSADLKLGNYLRINLIGPKTNKNGLDAKVTLETNEGSQYQQHTLTRGFQSSIDPVMHFGLGQATTIQKLTVQWPDGHTEILTNQDANQTLIVNHKNAKENSNNSLTHQSSQNTQKIFEEISGANGIEFKHQENIYNDYQSEVLLPHRYSMNGPGLAIGDINGDQLDDFYIGGAISNRGGLFTQTADGQFTRLENGIWEKDAQQEDMDAAFFDADGDGDLDLYVVSGGNEFNEGSEKLQDRLYINNGDNSFDRSTNSLPDMKYSGSKVRPADYDGDGDIDLFIGGRVVPKSYPLRAKSFILRNEGLTNGLPTFVDVTADVAPDLMAAGLVTDAIWLDFDNDQKLDLIVVGEWMPLTFLRNTGKVFRNRTEALGMDKTNGWWYSIAAADMDKDGDMDLIAGNLGLNYKYQASEKEPFEVYARDYDGNGKLDIVLGYYNDGKQYPVRGRQCSAEQIPTIKYKYEDYNSFAEASLEDIYTAKDLENSEHFKASTFASLYIENKGDNSFDFHPLPSAVQISSINGIEVDDFNDDGHLDLLLAGNLFSSEVETTRNDASYGSLLFGDGKGGFESIPYNKSGLLLGGDVKDIGQLETKKGKIIVVANNNADMQVFKMRGK